MVIGTALALSNGAIVVISVVLAFVFGYGLTSLPLLRAGLALAVVVPIALASDTLSIATMEVVDNAIVVAIPGALNAGLDSLLFWGSLSGLALHHRAHRPPGQPGASRARQGARRGPRDGRARRPERARRRGRGGGGGDLGAAVLIAEAVG